MSLTILHRFLFPNIFAKLPNDDISRLYTLDLLAV